MTGTNSADVLEGEWGDDLIVGKRGVDVLTGGRTPDDFVFTKSGLGRKSITDFDSDEDCIVLSTENDASWQPVADIIASVKAVGSGNYVYALRRGLKVETTVPLRADDFEVK